jgi:hypothetical protein
MYKALHLLQEEDKKKDRHKQIKAGWMTMLQNARQHPIVHINDTTPSRVMQGWISKQANQLTLKPLSSAGYSGKRPAVFHLFCVHNGKGPTQQDFQDEMMALWKAFPKQSTREKSEQEDRRLSKQKVRASQTTTMIKKVAVT